MKTFLIVIFLCPLISLVVEVDSETYLNKFAVHIEGGINVANRVARDCGFTNIGQIGDLTDNYLFEHPHVQRRSAEHSEEHHQLLTSHPQVRSFEQQILLSRKKRDFLPEPDLHQYRRSVDLEHHEEPEFYSREKRYEDKQHGREDKMFFNDDLYSKMWYYHGGGIDQTDMNVKGAWKKGVTGKGVVITILDDGIEKIHDDLKDNYDPEASYDVNQHDSDPSPRYDYTNENRHGTRCAGEVSAKANNTKCIVGVAYDSRIGELNSVNGDPNHYKIVVPLFGAAYAAPNKGIRMLDGEVYDAVEAESLSYNRGHIDIYSASWGPDDDGRVVDGPGVKAKKAFIDGVKLGRNGKGSIFVWASGNGGNQKDSCNCDGYTNSIYTLSISSLSQQGKKPWYLEECSSTLATTYSSGLYSEKQIISVDLHNRCTETHTGTSASAPLAAGIVALILEVSPQLTWRDVQYITLMTARPIGDGEWVTNGVGRKVSLRYGYGLMDATAMVELAEKWTNVPNQHICEQPSDVREMEIPDSGYEEFIDIEACAGTDQAINYLEHVQAKLTIQAKRRGDLIIHLTSPMGTRSTILPQRPNDGDCLKGFDGWAFLSVHFWGENPAGRWKLEIGVQKNRNSYFGGRCSGSDRTNKLVSWGLLLHGTRENPVNLKPGILTPTPPGPEVTATQPGPVTTTQSVVTSTAKVTTKVTTSQSHITTTTPSGCHIQCEGGCTGPGANQCKDCKNYQLEDSRMCVSVCPNNYYLKGTMCKPCDSSCKTCTTISANEVVCLSCKPGFLLIEGKGTCKLKCEAGYYKDGVSQHCRVCSGKCSECDTSPSHCTSCRAGMELFKNRCLSLEETCPADEYMIGDGSCQKCPSGCISCSSDKNCTCCSHGSYLKNGNCVKGCGTGYLPFHVNYSDELVFQQCQECQGACNVCPEGFNFINGVCVQQSNCPEGHYFQWNSMTCKPCNATCKSCIGPSNSDCLSCYPPLGYNNLLRRCMKCCIETATTVIDKTCCKCIEDGKCELSKFPEVEIQKQIMDVTRILLVLAAVVIVAVVIIGSIALYCSLRKKVPYSDVGYQKLLANEEKDLDNIDRPINCDEFDIIANGNLDMPNGEV